MMRATLLSQKLQLFHAHRRHFGCIEASYKQIIGQKQMVAHKRQLLVVDQMEKLNIELKIFLGRWRDEYSGSSFRSPSGMYLYGPTGCGKSMLMDMFYESCCIPEDMKSRSHFNSFMLDIHKRLHQLKKNKGRESVDPLKLIGQQLIQENGPLICLDEFQVTDVADAMILKRLFESLFSHGGIILATSNRSPDELYWGGLNRPVFLPFIPLLKSHCQVLDMHGMPDYRMLGQLNRDAFMYPLNESTEKRLETVWNTISNGRNPESVRIPVMMGRTLSVPKAYLEVDDANFATIPTEKDTIILETMVSSGACFFHFSQLCDESLGAADYLAIASNFSILVLSNIPLFDSSNKNQIRRFITLLDVMYDKKVCLICSASAAPHELFTIDGKPAAVTDTGPDSSNNSVGQTKFLHASAPTSTPMQSYVSSKGGSSGRQHTVLVGAAGEVEWSATGIKDASLAEQGQGQGQGQAGTRVREDELFAFQRTVSRLMEMQSPEYLLVAARAAAARRSSQNQHSSSSGSSSSSSSNKD